MEPFDGESRVARAGPPKSCSENSAQGEIKARSENQGFSSKEEQAVGAEVRLVRFFAAAFSFSLKLAALQYEIDGLIRL